MLIASKSKVAPTCQSTIPQLELIGALLLARLINDSIGKALESDVEHWPSLYYVALFGYMERTKIGSDLHKMSASNQITCAS